MVIYIKVEKPKRIKNIRKENLGDKRRKLKSKSLDILTKEEKEFKLRFRIK